MSTFKWLIGCLFMFATALHSQQNTILIIADDLGPDYLGFYGESTDTATTPNLRSLLSRGIRFDRVWAAPLCSTTRAGILTGRYPFRTGVGSIITNNTTTQLDTSEMTIARLLKYHAPVKVQTANVGKWHLHLQMPQKWLYPNIMGYDFYAGNFNGQISNYYNYTRITNGKLDTVKTYATTQTVTDAINWLKKTDKNKPVFLWLAFNAPHFPYHLPPAALCQTAGLPGTMQDINANPKKYFKAAVQAMDTEIGRLFAYLKEEGMYDKTNIIFIGDNGNDGKMAQFTDKSKAKGTLYNYGVRVPMVISGPAVAKPGSVSKALVNTPDLFATIAELSGFTDWQKAIPAGKTVDSRSLLPIISDEKSKIRDWIFTEQFTLPPIAEDGKTIRNEAYQLQRFDNGTEQFFHFESDPLQQENLLTKTLTSDQQSNYILLCNAMNGLLGLPICQVSGTSTSSLPTVLIAPNPANTHFNITCQQAIRQIWLIDNAGKKFNLPVTYQIDTSSLQEGIYSLHIALDNEVLYTQKIVVAHE